jgi:hypothetical protein
MTLLKFWTPIWFQVIDQEVVFEQMQKFMYKVFTNIILTSKGKLCVCAQSETIIFQNVYAALLEAYNDQLSTQFRSSKLFRDHFHAMDSRWRNGCERFINFWTTKNQVLEGIEDKVIDDDTKRTWLIQTLEYSNIVRQVITTELTIGEFSRTGHTGHCQNHFYSMVLLTAKILDNKRTKHTGCPKEANRNVRLNANNVTQNHSRSEKFLTKYKGPIMVMKSGLQFSPTD